jgi:hypothetical protein
MSRTSTLLSLTVVVLALALPGPAFALITGGTGNKPLGDPGWPEGAAAIFNHPGRVAWWEGPPFGGGEWHSECRGDAKALTAVLANFAAMPTKNKRVVVHDGTGHSFWLAPNREPEKLEGARIDWMFTVWLPASWDRLRDLPSDLNPTDAGDASPPSRLDVYTASLRWSDVTIPEGVEVVDERLEAHGFTVTDGFVIEGKVSDLATGQPIAATMRLERVEPRPEGGYLYPLLAEAKTDAQGRWFLKKVPLGWARVVVESEGHAPRVAGHARVDEGPRWQSFDAALARAAFVSGTVTDEDGKPLADVHVGLGNVRGQSGGRYELPITEAVRTDHKGRFRVAMVPTGSVTIWARKPGHVGPGLGVTVTTPKADVEMKMMRSAGLRVTVDFTGTTKPSGYVVSMSPEGGDRVGSYGGSGQIDAKDQMAFENVPPGRYVVRGRPNPGSDSEETAPVTVDLKPGVISEITLKAK